MKLLFLLLLIASSFSFKFLKRNYNRNKYCRHSSNCYEADSNIKTLQSISCDNFDLSLAVILAGYSFQAYNEPPIGKIAIGNDNTRIIFTSSDFIRKLFSGVVMIRLEKAEISKEFQKEGGLLEKISSGDNVDPYVTITVEENDKTRIIDSYTSTVKKSAAFPVWNETSFLYIVNPEYSKLNFTLLDKDYFKNDDIIGYGSFTVSEFLEFNNNNNKDSNSNTKPIKIPIPIYKNDNEKSWSLLPRPKRKRTGTLFIEASVIPFNMTQSTKPTIKTPSVLPVGATPGSVDWVRLISSVIEKRTLKSMKLNKDDKSEKQLTIVDSMTAGLHQICSIDNLDTDTQGTIWADIPKRELILSFRGTEQIKLKDILTDINIIQVPFDETSKQLKDVRMHSGFLRAYQSVQAALLQILNALLKDKTNDTNDPWNIYITGHSLGGALATIMAFDLARIKNKYFGSNDAFLKYFDDDTEFLESLSKAKVTMITYGAPRVGDLQFSNLFNTLIPNSFRVVNNKDIVARIPRGTSANRLIGYEHVGKTVMVDDETLGTIWIEGESDGQCPLADISPIYNKNIVTISNTEVDTNRLFIKDTIKNINTNIVDKISNITETLKNSASSSASINININTDESYNISLSSNSVIDNLSKAANNAAMDITMKLDSQVESILSFSDATQKSLLNTAINITGISEDGFNNLYNIASDISKGFDSSFVEREIGILNAIMDGSALDHHLEPSYFQSLEKALDLHLEESYFRAIEKANLSLKEEKNEINNN